MCDSALQKAATCRRKGGGHVKRTEPVCLPTFPCNAAESVCVHIMAAGQVVGFTSRLRLEAATHLVASGLITVDADTGICSCQALADVLKVVHFRPKEGFCTCHDRTLHGTCCHLQAAPLLEEFRGWSCLQQWTRRQAMARRCA